MYKACMLLCPLVLGVSLAPAAPVKAAETAFSTYGLGGAAFGAGQTPPPGTYVSFVGAYYTADIGGAVTIGGELLTLGVEVDLLLTSLNGTYVPAWTMFGGRPALSVTVPAGHIDLEANANLGALARTRDVSGSGLGDANIRLQLGWQHGAFSHLIYMQGVVPTGRYDTGFRPNIGLNRPSIDVGWAFTWLEPTAKLQINGALGVNFNAENTDTDYKTGNEFHFEWAIGREIARGLVVGIVGYDYRQFSDDSGAGAILGPFRGDVDALGPGLSYTTMIDSSPLIVNLRHYQEFNAERRWEGSMTILSGTLRF